MKLPATLLFASLWGMVACESPPASFVETVGGEEFRMILLPGGRTSMGCVGPIEECGLGPREEVLHPFYIATTETTWGLYDLCIQASRCPRNDEHGGDNGWGRGDRPVIEVSWNDVTYSFLPWLNEATGRSYRLPTEAEWEYAARAGSPSRYSWGDEADCERARFGFLSGECGDEPGTVPVGRYPPNGFGLHDMEGNVWEFVQDCWLEGAAPPASVSGEPVCKESVLRGGSWLNASDEVTLNYRFRHDRSFRESGDGFRLALSPDGWISPIPRSP